MTNRSVFNRFVLKAYVAANDDMIAVVFRGTKEAPDWATNLNVRRRDVPESWGMQSGVVHEVRGFLCLSASCIGS